ncbi:MAG: amidohydrolase, partial [Gemmatimonadales bacterium]
MRRRHFFLRSMVLLFPFSMAAAPAGGQTVAETLTGLDTRGSEYGEVARRIWEWAEVGYQETRSSALLEDRLREAGFTVEAGVAGIPTAFVATWGNGGPVIGILGEFDALPGLSQDAVPTAKPLLVGGSGHACGHHLLGT